MTTRDNYLSRIEYELSVVNRFDGSVDKITKTWKDADHELKKDKNIGKQMNKGALVKHLFTPEIKTLNSRLNKAKAIHEFVQSNYTWNGKHKIFKDVSIKKLLQEKSGSASDINLLLYNMLKESNIDVTPILISTRKNGLPTKIYPVISDFNYIIIQANIDDKTYLLDATSSYLSFGQLPFKCLNQYGRFLDLKNGSYWVDINAIENSSKNYRVELAVTENDVTGNLKFKATGYKAYSKKKQYYTNQANYLDDYKNNQSDFEVIEHSVLVESKNSNTFTETIDFELLNDNIGGDIYLNPFVSVFLNENPLKLQERTYPIDFGYKDNYVYSCKITFDPAKYQVTELPKTGSYKIPNNTGQLIFNSTKSGGEIMVYLKFNFSETIYHAGYYKYLKAYFNKIIDIQKNSIIVLKKK